MPPRIANVSGHLDFAVQHGCIGVCPECWRMPVVIRGDIYAPQKGESSQNYERFTQRFSRDCEALVWRRWLRLIHRFRRSKPGPYFRLTKCSTREIAHSSRFT